MIDDDGGIVARDRAVGFALGIGLRSEAWGKCILLTANTGLAGASTAAAYPSYYPQYYAPYYQPPYYGYAEPGYPYYAGYGYGVPVAVGIGLRFGRGFRHGGGFHRGGFHRGDGGRGGGGHGRHR